MELRNLATLIRLSDILCCQEKIGFYLSAQNEAITEEMLDSLQLTTEQFEEVRANLPDKLVDAEATLS